MTLFAISTIEAMSYFSGSLNRPQKFGTAQGSSPIPSRLALSSTLPIVATSLAVVAGVLPVVAGSPAPLLVKAKVLVGNLLVSPWSCSVLSSLLLTRGNSPLMKVYSVKGNGL